MKRIAVFILGVMTVSTSALAQGRGAPAPPAPLEAGASQADVDKAVLALPENMRNLTMVIKWKPDFTYDTLKPGTNRIVCYDQSGLPSEQPFSVQCTSVANLERVAQNRKFEVETDRAKRQAAIDAAEANGTRVKPEYGSVWYTLAGADQATARMHMTVAMPGATAAATGIPDNNKQGGVWIMNAGTSTAHLMIPGS